MLDYRLIAALDAVIEAGTFERAAERLGLTQSAVSQRIRQLEERIGQILLVRSSPPRATEAGQRLLGHYRRVRLLEQDLPADLHPDRHSETPVLPLAVNADSLATWFMPVLDRITTEEGVLIDLRIADQDVTHTLLRRGEVAACVSAWSKPIQGCTRHRLGVMRYRLCATPDFSRRWFPEGLSRDAVSAAPAAIFNRDDSLHHRLLRLELNRMPERIACHYLPSHAAFNHMILAGQAYGSMIEDEVREHLSTGRLIDLLAGRGLEVELYWHAWALGAGLLDRVGRLVRTEAGRRLPAGRE